MLFIKTNIYYFYHKSIFENSTKISDNIWKAIDTFWDFRKGPGILVENFYKIECFIHHQINIHEKHSYAIFHFKNGKFNKIAEAENSDLKCYFQCSNNKEENEFYDLCEDCINLLWHPTNQRLIDLYNKQKPIHFFEPDITYMNQKQCRSFDLITGL